jgi:predicted MFS family arabinose efflux permease
VSYLSAALRAIPFRLCGGIGEFLGGALAQRVPRRWSLLIGQLLMGGGAVLFALADTKDKYWSHLIPASILGWGGTGFVYVVCLAAAMVDAKPEVGGVTSAVMYTATQLGATVGLTGASVLIATGCTVGLYSSVVVTAINVGVTGGQTTDSSIHEGIKAGFFSLLGMNGVMALLCLISFWRSKPQVS